MNSTLTVLPPLMVRPTPSATSPAEGSQNSSMSVSPDFEHQWPVSQPKVRAGESAAGMAPANRPGRRTESEWRTGTVRFFSWPHFAPVAALALEQIRSVHGNAHMDYQEFAPPAALAGQVACAWRLRDATPPDAPRTIFPDGHCELIVHLGMPPQCWDAVDGWHPQARTLFAAQRVAAVRLRASGVLDCVGVRLRPARSNAVMPGAALRFRDRVVDLATLDAPFARALARAARNFRGMNPRSCGR